MKQNDSEKKEIWRKVYQFLATMNSAGLEMMNYGYEPDGSFSSVTEESDERTSRQLYQRVVERVSLDGTSVLEVGCGRGGGAAFIKRQFAPAHLCGLDYSDNAVKICQERYAGVEGLSFRCGDAENLPFSDAEFDAVINVESSHCYASRPTFFREVFRVLRPGGAFLYADIFEGPDECLESLTDTGFQVRAQEDITAGVLRSLDSNHDRRVKTFAEIPQPRRGLLENMAGLKGSPAYRAFKSGHFVYLRYQLHKALQT